MNHKIELADCTNTLLTEISMQKSTQKDIAQTYRLAMQSSEATDWTRVNQAIVERWSVAGLQRIKSMAHSGRCFE